MGQPELELSSAFQPPSPLLSQPDEASAQQVAFDKKKNAEILASGYTKTKRTLEITSVSIFALLLIISFLRITSSLYFLRNFWVSLCACVLSMCVADFFSGIAHCMFPTLSSHLSPSFYALLILIYTALHLLPHLVLTSAPFALLTTYLHIISTTPYPRTPYKQHTTALPNTITSAPTTTECGTFLMLYHVKGVQILGGALRHHLWEAPLSDRSENITLLPLLCATMIFLKRMVPPPFPLPLLPLFTGIQVTTA